MHWQMDSVNIELNFIFENWETLLDKAPDPLICFV